MDVLRALKLDIEYIEFPTGEHWVRKETEAKAREAIDHSDSTLFGSTSGKTTAITYLRWGKQTYANVRPCRYLKGFRSPLKNPDHIDYVIVRENLEDAYLGMEGPTGATRAGEALQQNPARAAGYHGEWPLLDQSDHRKEHAAGRALRMRTRDEAQTRRRQGQDHLHLEVQHAARGRRILPSASARRRRRGIRNSSTKILSSMISRGASCSRRMNSTWW